MILASISGSPSLQVSASSMHETQCMLACRWRPGHVHYLIAL
jgi:hypothetical protein